MIPNDLFAAKSRAVWDMISKANSSHFCWSYLSALQKKPTGDWWPALCQFFHQESQLTITCLQESAKLYRLERLQAEAQIGPTATWDFPRVLWGPADEAAEILEVPNL